MFAIHVPILETINGASCQASNVHPDAEDVVDIAVTAHGQGKLCSLILVRVDVRIKDTFHDRIDIRKRRVQGETTNLIRGLNLLEIRQVIIGIDFKAILTTFFQAKKDRLQGTAAGSVIDQENHYLLQTYRFHRVTCRPRHFSTLETKVW